jgi:hypothetical protein
MGVLGAAKERVKGAVPGMTTEVERQRQAMVDLAEQQGVQPGYFRCEDCGTVRTVDRLGGPAITKSPEGKVQVIARCKRCSVKWDVHDGDESE